MTPQREVEYVDVELVRGAKNGDLAAFEKLFNRYQKRVYNIVYGVVGNENDAAELTQDVFVRVYRAIKDLKAEQAFFTWVRTLAINRCRDFMRRKPPVRVESLDEKLSYGGEELDREVADYSSDPADLLETKDVGQAVHRAIASLSREHRTVVTLHHIEGMDLCEISKAMGCPVGTVKSRLARAREELRRKLVPYIRD